MVFIVNIFGSKRNNLTFSGMIGQVLYLEAEANGVRGTGIGCFFDDCVHEILGCENSLTFQSLYHFTVGGPLEDERLQTLDGYEAKETNPFTVF